MLLGDLRQQGWNIVWTARLCFVMYVFWNIRVLPVLLAYTSYIYLYAYIY